MKSKLTLVALSLAWALAGCGGDSPPRTDAKGGGDSGSSDAGGGGGDSGGTGGTGGSSNDGPGSETGPSNDGPRSEGGVDGPAGSPTGPASPAGRRFVSADGRFILEIPPGALRSPIDVAITVASPPPGGSLGAAYEIEPADEPLLVPARVFFRYTAAELAGGRPSDLRIGLRQGNSWLSLPDVAADASITVVEAALSRLGVVGLLPGLCQVCDSACVPADCKVASDPNEMPTIPGKCFDHGMGCKRCVPTCDGDGDGFCLGDPSGGEQGGDCADDDPSRFPGAREICGNMLDDNCDTRIDEGCKACTTHSECTGASEACLEGVCNVCMGECAVGQACTTDTGAGRCNAFGNGCTLCVPACDTDGDGFCPQAIGDLAADCDDSNPARSPGRKEICGNNVDDDCNGSVDDLCKDCDGDDDCAQNNQVCRHGACAACTQGCTAGAACTFTVEGVATPFTGKCEQFGRNESCGVCVPTCDMDADGFCAGDPEGDLPGGDCDADNPEINPAADEICGNDEDDNCNGEEDEGCARCLQHADCMPQQACGEGRACVTCEAACPAAEECRFGADEGVPNSGVAGRCADYARGCKRCVPTCDLDGDGFCPQMDPGNDQPGGDCDDAAITTFLGAVEICGNRVDDDCDGEKDEDCAVTTCSMSATCGINESCSSGR